MGNAKTAGLTDDLGFTGNQYNIIVSIFFVPYVLFAPPVAMVGKKYGPHRVLPMMMFGFGSMTLLMAAVQNFSGVFALRFILGACESAFFPLVIYYLTTFYRRGELARRLALFYAASNIANAFVSTYTTLPPPRSLNGVISILRLFLSRTEANNPVEWAFGFWSFPDPEPGL